MHMTKVFNIWIKGNEVVHFRIAFLLHLRCDAVCKEIYIINARNSKKKIVSKMIPLTPFEMLFILGGDGE